MSSSNSKLFILILVGALILAGVIFGTKSDAPVDQPPVIVEPEVIEPEVVEPEVIEPEVIEPDIAEPEVVDPNEAAVQMLDEIIEEATEELAKK